MNSIGNMIDVPESLRPPPHEYCGYAGPWIENAFYTYFRTHRPNVSKTYLPIFWTDYYCLHGFRPHEEIQTFLNRSLRPDKEYFTLVQSDDGILEQIPDNVEVFAAGGVGDVPIPLLKADLRSQQKELRRNIPVSYMGNLSTRQGPIDVRTKMLAACQGREGYFFSRGSLQDFIDVVNRSVFSLCPRGYGRTSFRLYEAMALGSIPIYLWDDVCWLPYQEMLDWSQFSISLNIRQIDELPNLLEQQTPADIAARQQRLAEVYPKFFTMDAVCEIICKRLTQTAATSTAHTASIQPSIQRISGHVS